MSIRSLMGRPARLPIRRFGPPGAYLDVGDGEDILLIGHETPREAKVGDALDVFVHLDSEGRPIATTRPSKLALGEVAFLRVSAVTPIGAFFDWGLAKELLVPFVEQTVDVQPGDRHAVGLYLDDSDRLTGTMKVSEMLSRQRRKLPLDAWIDGEAWRWDRGIGLFVILERRQVGLVPASEHHGLKRGEAAKFRVTHVQPDGKIELSLRGHAHEELADDAERILARLRERDAPRVGDHTSPDDLRDHFGLSKKAFKRALGRLLKEGKVKLDAEGNAVPV